MEDLFIEGTKMLPTVTMKSDGTIKLEGRALPENAFLYFKPLIEWTKSFSNKDVDIKVNLEYFNTAVSKQLLDLFKAIEANPANENIHITWMYEEGDDEMLESGEIYEDILKRCRFTYKQYAEIPNK